MKELFKHLDIQDFNRQFSTEEACLKFLAEYKWKDGFKCKKCGHTNYCKGKNPHSRRCTRCKSEESATAHTMFHRCRINLPDAFKITFLVCNNPQISINELSQEINLRQMTCWRLKTRIMDCIENNSSFTEPQKAEFRKKLM
ncbi:MAG: transposase [Bacteroidales bacterium]|nr:transposase [Bacteroidales bacterium]MCF8326897.1 transposase [Bacteroidales bacterium]